MNVAQSFLMQGLKVECVTTATYTTALRPLFQTDSFLELIL